MTNIIIKGAKENNLQNINLYIPRNQIVCFVGVSGSGKSTIAFDIIASEAQRQYFESLPSYARRYLPKTNRPNIESIHGISSAIVISQEKIVGNPRSTVGTLTDTYALLRMLFSRAGLPTLDSSYFSFNHPNGACLKCKGIGKVAEIDVRKLIDFDKSLNQGAILHPRWHMGGRTWSIIRATNFYDMDKKICDFGQDELEKLLYAPKQLWQDENNYGANKWTYQGVITQINNSRQDRDKQKYATSANCTECNGWRLNSKALKVCLNDKNIGEVANMPLPDCLSFVKSIKLPQAEVIKPQLEQQLQNLIDAGVSYLNLNRSTDTLSGGEAQRVKIAKQIGCDLTETIYVMDEPTAGLHQRDIKRVISSMEKLRDKGNTIIVVEHDESVIRVADYIVEIGPGGGKNGGEIIAQGTLNEILDNPKSVTAKYLSISKPTYNRQLRKATGALTIKNTTLHNLKNISVDIPTGIFVALTGVSGSGKSSLVEEVVAQHGDKVALIDQSPVGNNKRGCIGTYTGIFDIVRKILAKKYGVSESIFSFNSKGACPECKGLGHIDMEMNFLGNVRIHCESCDGSRYKKEVLEYTHDNKNIAEILKMTASEVNEFFNNSEIKRKTQLLIDVGLDYLEIGQTLDTLSGGESQRLKLASRLQNKSEFYILDEPTSGLHVADIAKLLTLLNRLVDNGNTILVVEHDQFLILQSDWIIEVGPEGGDKGGRIIFEGTPKEINK